METADQRRERVARSWDQAAEGYVRYFVPRFAPWVRDAVAAVARLPAGPILAPCCGPGHELEQLASRHPGREVVGVDLSAGMVAIAQTCVASRPEARVEHGDASRLAPRFGLRAAAVFSAFGLQQIPEADRALEDWACCLAPGGCLSVVFWPAASEEAGPFATLRALLAERGPPPDASWEERLEEALARADVHVVHDRAASHVVRHASAAELFQALATAGPLRALALLRGDAFMTELERAFVAAVPPGEVVHAPRARWIVARRLP